MTILINIFGFLTYDPVRDFDKRLPVRGRRTATDRVERTAMTTTGDDVHEGPDKLYGRRTTTNDSGATVYELDSTDIRTGTDVNPSRTKYDLFVFWKYKEQDTYKHFKLELYELIKKEAFSQSKDGKPISYRDAAKLPGIKGRRGCGERYLANYYKAMNEAFTMECHKTPLPQQ